MSIIWIDFLGLFPLGLFVWAPLHLFAFHLNRGGSGIRTHDRVICNTFDAVNPPKWRFVAYYGSIDINEPKNACKLLFPFNHHATVLKLEDVRYQIGPISKLDSASFSVEVLKLIDQCQCSNRKTQFCLSVLKSEKLFSIPRTTPTPFKAFIKKIVFSLMQASCQ